MAGNERTLVKVRCGHDGSCGRLVAEVTATGAVLAFTVKGPKGSERLEYPPTLGRRPWCREHGIRTPAQGALAAAVQRARRGGSPETVTC